MVNSRSLFLGYRLSQQRFIGVGLLASVALLGLAYLFQPQPASERSPSIHTRKGPATTKTDVATHVAKKKPKSTKLGLPPEAPDGGIVDREASPEGVADRPAPISPAEEGLFALADASGRTVARCAIADYPEGTTFSDGDDQVVTDQFVTFLVDPSSDGPGFLMSINPPYLQQISDAEIGGMGRCTISEFEPGELTVSAPDIASIDFEARAEEKNVQTEQVIKDVEEEMLPEQVALDTPGLSPAARQWLLERITDREDKALEEEERPATPEQLLEDQKLFEKYLAETLQ